MQVIGVLHGVSAAQWTDRMTGFHSGLSEAGFAEGRNLAIEYRWAEGRFDRLMSWLPASPAAKSLLFLLARAMSLFARR